MAAAQWPSCGQQAAHLPLLLRQQPAAEASLRCWTRPPTATGAGASRSCKAWACWAATTPAAGLVEHRRHARCRMSACPWAAPCCSTWCAQLAGEHIARAGRGCPFWADIPLGAVHAWLRQAWLRPTYLPNAAGLGPAISAVPSTAAHSTSPAPSTGGGAARSHRRCGAGGARRTAPGQVCAAGRACQWCQQDTGGSSPARQCCQMHSLQESGRWAVAHGLQRRRLPTPHAASPQSSAGT